MYCLILAPWWIYNYNNYGEFVRLNTGFGKVLFSGNNIVNQSGGGNINEDVILPKIEEKNIVLIDKQLKNLALDFIIHNPLIFIKNCF